MVIIDFLPPKASFERSLIYWLVLLFGCMHSLWGEVRVQAEVDKGNHFENFAIPVTIIITHSAKELVDEKSFFLGKDPFTVTKVQDVGDTETDADILTIYHYDLPGKPKGLHILPVITARIGGQAYQSVASTFEVKATDSKPVSAPPQAPVASSSSSGGIFLKLENIIEGPTTLFPGQTTTLGYRYSFNANIETTEEITPLFEPKGFLKVGDKIVNKKDSGNTSILEVTQQFQAQDVGEYKIGPSTIEGYVYQENYLGKRTYEKDKLKSVTAPVTLTIKPLPEKNKPASFNGAVGKYTFTVALKTSSKVTVGDEMNLQIEIAGTGDLDTVQLPDLCCQPGMSGLFKLSDLPPVGKIEGKAKRFSVDLRPLTSAINEIPSFEFSFFNPDTQKFVILRSAPIPIQVVELKKSQPEKIEAPVESPKDQEQWRQVLNNPPPIDVEGNYVLTEQDLHNRWFGSWWTLLLLPLAGVLLMYQTNLRRYMQKRENEVPAVNSSYLFEDAWKEEPYSSSFYNKLYKAFYVRLQERGDINTDIHAIENLPQEGAAGDVKALLLSIEEARYAGDKGLKQNTLLEKARRLFEELEVKR